MALVTTAVPSGIIGDWCVHHLDQGQLADQFQQGCANATKGTMDSDFETICCDGDIIDTTADLFRHSGKVYLDLANLVCCRIEGNQQGGLLPLQSDNGRTCTEGTPTPLASLAATNTDNAVIYPVTYTSASGEAPNIGDFLYTLTPYCLWANTKSVDGMADVTVLAARISTLPVGWPDSDNPLILSSYPTPVYTAGILSSAIGIESITEGDSRTRSRTTLPYVSQTSSGAGITRGPTDSVASAASSSSVPTFISTATATGTSTSGTRPPQNFALHIIALAVLCGLLHP